MDWLRLKIINIPRLKKISPIIAVLIIFGASIVMLTAIFLISGESGSKGRRIVKVNGQEINVEIASTPEQQYQGLSDRREICAACGLLFVFPDAGIKSFVMRNMNFPLDIIFIDNGTIKNIAANLKPEGSEPKNIYESAGAANQVLEVNGGYCEKYNIKPGDKIILE